MVVGTGVAAEEGTRGVVVDKRLAALGKAVVVVGDSIERVRSGLAAGRMAEVHSGAEL